MSERDLERLFAGLEPASPPTGTRDRALAAARAAEVGAVVAEDRWTRLWQSRPARLAWAATVVALLLAHAVLSIAGAVHGGRPALPAPVAGLSEDEPALAVIAELPPLRLGLLPVIDPFGRPAAATTDASRLSSRRPS